MKTFEIILGNSVKNLFSKHFKCDSWNKSSISRDSLREMSVDELADLVFQFQSDYVCLVHDLGEISDFVDFYNKNSEVVK